MSVETMMKKVNSLVQAFSLSEECVFHVIELADRRNALPGNTQERSDATGDIRGYLSMMSDRELQEMMCLMDFGRNISYYGFNRDVAETFIDHVGTKHFAHIRGGAAADYLAGKSPLGDWLRLAGKQIKADALPDNFFRIVFYKPGVEGKDHALDFFDEAIAWASFRKLVRAETAEEYSSIHLMGYSYTGRAETHMASVHFG